MLLTDVMTYLMKGTLTNIKGVLKGDGKNLGEIGVDTTPTANSKNLIESGAVKSALDDKQNKITSSGVLIGDGSGGISSKTLDTSTLTDDNNHIPTSGVVKSAIDLVVQSETKTVTTNSSGWVLLYNSTGRIPISGHISAEDADNIVLIFKTKDGKIWGRLLTTSFVPVEATVAMTYYYTT